MDFEDFIELITEEYRGKLFFIVENKECTAIRWGAGKYYGEQDIGATYKEEHIESGQIHIEAVRLELNAWCNRFAKMRADNKR